ncbi:MAG: hypothetical protein Kow0022_00930 [Phycisphaerales bacterium]
MKIKCAGLVALAASTASGDVNLEFRPEAGVIGVGQAARVGLYATWDGSGAGQTVSAIELVFSWDTGYLSLTGLDGTGGASLITSDFPLTGSGGLNESAPPGDGDGLYRAFAMLGTPIDVSVPGGALITTFLFQGLAETPATPVDILASGGSPEVFTRVFDGTVPNTVVTGTLTGTTITIVPAPGAGVLLLTAAFAARRRRR